jgi:hypothetical protein
VLRDVLAEAGNLTARVALAPNRAGRIDAARDAAARMRGLVDFAHWASGGATWHVQVLHNLADALDRYDLTQIALLSDQRADAVIALELQLAPGLGTAPEIRAQEGGS